MQLHLQWKKGKGVGSKIIRKDIWDLYELLARQPVVHFAYIDGPFFAANDTSECKLIVQTIGGTECHVKVAPDLKTLTIEQIEGQVDILETLLPTLSYIAVEEEPKPEKQGE